MGALLAALLAGVLGLAVLAVLEAGRRLGRRDRARNPEGAPVGTGAMEAAIFGLLGLLVAFTFSGAATRFDGRRQLVVEEANAIGTAYLRLDLLREEPRQALRAKFRRYLDGRLETYRLVPDLVAVKAALERTAALQYEIWADAVAGVRDSPVAGAHLLLIALNEMIDITTTRTAASQVHPPPVIYGMLAGVALVSALLAGYDMTGKARPTVYMLAFAVVLGAALYVILDLEYPRLGLIRVDAADQVLVDLRKSMDPPPAGAP